MDTRNRNNRCPDVSERQQVRMLAEKVEELLVRAHRISQLIENRVRCVLDDLPELKPNRHPGPANGKHRNGQHWGKEKRPA